MKSFIELILDIGLFHGMQTDMRDPRKDVIHKIMHL